MESKSLIQKVAVVGNIAGGKTRLSRKLATLHELPLTHVDSVQFQAGMIIRPMAETRKKMLEIEGQDKWLIDGYGPLDLIEKRFALADRVVFIDLPLATHIWWCSKRQIENIWSRRAELPEGCSELTWSHTLKLFKTLWGMHQKMRPELIRIFNRENLKEKMIFIRDQKSWDSIFENGLK